MTSNNSSSNSLTSRGTTTRVGMGTETSHVTWYWLSNSRFTIAVRVRDNGRVAQAPPIARKFLGQPIDNLRRWMMKFPEYKEVLMKPTTR